MLTNKRDDTETAALEEASAARDQDRRIALALLLNLARVGGAVTAEMQRREIIVTGNAEVLVLVTLDTVGPQRPTDLMEITRLSSGGMTKVLDRLEALALITRAHGQIAGDRRAIVIAVTPEGHATAETIIQATVDCLGVVEEAIEAVEKVMGRRPTTDDDRGPDPTDP